MLHIIGYCLALLLSYFYYETKHGYTNVTHLYFAIIAIMLDSYDFMVLTSIHFLIDIFLQHYYKSLTIALFIHHITALTGAILAIYTNTTEYFWYGSLFEISSIILNLFCIGWLSEYWFDMLFAPVFIYFRIFLFNYVILQTDFMNHMTPLVFWIIMNLLNCYMMTLIWGKYKKQ